MQECTTRWNYSLPETNSIVLERFLEMRLKQNSDGSSWVLAPGVDPRLSSQKFFDQAAIETVKNELVCRMGAFSASNSPDTRILGSLNTNQLRRDRSALHLIFC